MTALCLLAATSWVWAAASVTVSGVFGEKALVSVNGGPPRVMAVGDSQRGVKLLSVRGQRVEIEEGGSRRVLEVGFGSAVGTSSENAGVVLLADGRGQFYAEGEVNGANVRFLVDTGASMVVLPRALAQRTGVSLANAPRTVVNTANGRVSASRVMLNNVRVGNIRVNMVEALVLEDVGLAIPLLGMSFLQRTTMRHEGDRLVLRQRY